MGSNFTSINRYGATRGMPWAVPKRSERSSDDLCLTSHSFAAQHKSMWNLSYYCMGYGSGSGMSTASSERTSWPWGDRYSAETISHQFRQSGQHSPPNTVLQSPFLCDPEWPTHDRADVIWASPGPGQQRPSCRGLQGRQPKLALRVPVASMHSLG